MKRNPWFRMYHEFATDQKVQMMSESDQRRLVMLFCLRCCNGHVTLRNEEIAFQLRVTETEWLKTKEIFVAKGFIDEGNNLINWGKRQYISDSSTERVRKHREKDKKRNKVKRYTNVTVTPPDTDTDTDKPPISPKGDELFSKFWESYPKKVGKGAAEKSWKKIKQPSSTLKEILNALEWQTVSDFWTKDNGQYIPNPSTYLNQRRWEDQMAEKIKVANVYARDVPEWMTKAENG